VATITEQIQTELAAAAKAQDKRRLSGLRLVLDALKKESKEARDELDEQAEAAVLKRERKRRIEAAKAYRDGGRPELAEAEEAEAALIDEYLPEQVTDDELEALVADAVASTGAASPREMGKVMAAVMARVGARADGLRVSELVRAKLESGGGEA
jgi:uncharacterized protein